MRTAERIKGTLASCDLTYQEFSELCGVSRQMIFAYLNKPGVHIEDYDKGMVCVRVAKQLLALAEEGVLPLKCDKAEKVEKVRELLTV